MTEVEEKKSLEILNQVRTMLSKAFEDESNCRPKSFSNPIATDYPIKPIKNQGDFKFHGWCEIETQGGWVRKLNVEKAKKFFIRNLFVQLLSENGSILPREILLPTFLHELSHTVTTPQKWQVNSIPNEIREEGFTKSSADQWVILHHSPDFYSNFALILQMAEKLGIYTLMSCANKYSARNLKRFDSIDLISSIKGLNLGHSPMFGTKDTSKLRIILTNSQKTKQKPVLIEKRSIEEVLKEAKKRLNLRKNPSKAVCSSGELVSDETLAVMENDTILTIL